MATIRGKRAYPSKAVETQILVASRRRCCLCFYLDGIRTPQRGQIAHLIDRTESEAKDLVFLCLNHHDAFDSRPSQSKGFTSDEVRTFRDLLYKELGTQDDATRFSSDSVNPKTGVNAPSTIATHVDTALRKPWRAVSLSGDGPELFAYKSPNRCDGICRVEQLRLADGRTAVIIQEIDGNPGMSVTNAIEWVTRQLCEALNLDHQEAVWIEHYDTWFSRDDEWNLVTFAPKSTKDEFGSPKWTPMTAEDWRRLGIAPRSRPSRRTMPRSMMTKAQNRR